jgi:uncharacterized protein (UPF0335 family)
MHCCPGYVQLAFRPDPMALSDIGRLWTLARKLEQLFSLHNKVEASLQIVDERLRALEDRMLRLEMEQGRVFSEARNTATVMASSVISDTVTRITRLEGVADRLAKRFPPEP